jgi:hypothetical protein
MVAKAKGRPVSYSKKIATRIVAGMMDGLSLKKICDSPDMPSRRSVLNWAAKYSEFAELISSARVLQADFHEDQVAALIEKITPESANADRVKLQGLQWLAAVQNPKRYSQKNNVELSTPDGKPFQVQEMRPWQPLSPPEVAAAMQRLLKEAEIECLPKEERPTNLLEVPDSERLRRVIASGRPVPPVLYDAIITGKAKDAR